MSNNNPLSAIREKCLDCACGSSYEVSLCPVSDCSLFPFRFGKNPYRKKRIVSEELTAQRVENLRKYREEKKGGSLD